MRCCVDAYIGSKWFSHLNGPAIRVSQLRLWGEMLWTPTPTLQANRFQFEVSHETCVGPAGREFLMGGVAMAVAIDALERWSEKPLLWATIQFLHAGALDDQIDIFADRVGGGRSVVQAAATLQSGETPLQTMSAALGARSAEPPEQFINMPTVPDPADCPTKEDDALGQDDNLIDQFERRTALEDPDRGIELMWIKPVVPIEMSSSLLALTSDFLLGAHERSRGGTSLDNTLRICALQPTEWILSATQITHFGGGAAHGTQRQFAQDGKLLSISSQTGLLPRSAHP